MSTKLSLSIAAALIIAGVAILAYFRIPGTEPAPAPVATTTPPAVDLTLIGQVTEVNFEQVAADGPTVVTFTTAGTNEVRQVAVPSMGLPLCPAADEIADAFQLAPGDRIEVRGRVDAAGVLVPCEDTGHYLRATRTEAKTEYGFSFTYEKGPRGYVLEEGTLEANDEALEVLYSGVFTNTEDYAAFVASDEAREGPETFSVRVYENAANLRPAQWIEAYEAESNLPLIIGETEETVVAGANAVRYISDGLYPTNTFVVAHGDFMYVLAGQYNDPLSAIGVDFGEFVAALTFIPTGNEVVPLSAE